MNLYSLLQKRQAEGRPIRVGLIGAGKFGTMYINQVRHIPGVHLTGVADLSLERARDSFKRTGWEPGRIDAPSLEAAQKNGKTCLLESSSELIASPYVDIVIEATGNPEVGIGHVLKCCENKKHIIMVNVEADAVAGPLLAKKAAEAGIVYSLAYGDQPAIICEMVDWARAAGFEVSAAGKGTKYLPIYHTSTPDTIWPYYGFTPEMVAKGDFNAKMFNSFLDGTKSAIEMAAVSNATGLLPASNGLEFPPCGVDDLPIVMRTKEDGGHLERMGQVEVVSSLERDGRPVYRDLRWGVYVNFKGDSEYIRKCFKEYGMHTDDSGAYAGLYRPYHCIGLELGISVASIGLRNEPTGFPRNFYGDVVATAKRDIVPGETLDGEGGYTVYGKLMPAATSLACGGIPLGLCNKVKVLKPIKAGSLVSWNDVQFNADNQAVKVRREMERTFK